MTKEMIGNLEKTTKRRHRKNDLNVELSEQNNVGGFKYKLINICYSMIQEEEPLKQLGVELSSTKCVIALATGSAIEIMLSDSSAREIPNFIGFKDGERFIGEAGFL